MKILMMQLKHGIGGMMSDKWCPFVRIMVGTDDFYDNRGKFSGKDYPTTHCIKEKCACWIEIWTYDGKTDREVDLGHCGLINNG